MVRSLAGLVALIVVGGCTAVGQSDFSCSGPTPGLSCLPATQVYEITNDPELHRKVVSALEAAAQENDELDHQAIVAAVIATHKPQVEVVKKIAKTVTQPQPVLHPAEVLRIYLSPWVDAKGDLHMPSYVFTEVTPRRWSIGEELLPEMQILAPIQTERKDES